MKSYGEYCPIAMGAEAIGDRWSPLVLRELACGSERFSDIHRGMPRVSRTLLSKRLDQLRRLGVVERTDDGHYRLTDSGRQLTDVVWQLGTWASEHLLGDPEADHFDGVHLMWRVHQRVVAEALPDRRVVVQFDLRRASRGRRIWLILDAPNATVCERDEGFAVDLWVDADIEEFLRVWAGRSRWADAIEAGSVVLHGPRDLVAAFPTWLALSPFAHPSGAGRR